MAVAHIARRVGPLKNVGSEWDAIKIQSPPWKKMLQPARSGHLCSAYLYRDNHESLQAVICVLECSALRNENTVNTGGLPSDPGGLMWAKAMIYTLCGLQGRTRTKGWKLERPFHTDDGKCSWTVQIEKNWLPWEEVLFSSHFLVCFLGWQKLGEHCYREQGKGVARELAEAPDKAPFLRRSEALRQAQGAWNWEQVFQRGRRASALPPPSHNSKEFTLIHENWSYFSLDFYTSADFYNSGFKWEIIIMEKKKLRYTESLNSLLNCHGGRLQHLLSIYENSALLLNSSNTNKCGLICQGKMARISKVFPFHWKWRSNNLTI